MFLSLTFAAILLAATIAKLEERVLKPAETKGPQSVDKEETEPRTCGLYVTSGDEILTREDSELKAITRRQWHDLYNANC